MPVKGWGRLCKLLKHSNSVITCFFKTKFKDVFDDEVGTLPGHVHHKIDFEANPVAITSC